MSVLFIFSAGGKQKLNHHQPVQPHGYRSSCYKQSLLTGHFHVSRTSGFFFPVEVIPSFRYFFKTSSSFPSLCISYFLLYPRGSHVMANILLENSSRSCTGILLGAYQHHSQINQTVVCLISQDIFFPQSEKSYLSEFPATVLCGFKASSLAEEYVLLN